MSHIVEVKPQVRDVLAVRAACRRLGLAEQLTSEFYQAAHAPQQVHEQG
jgi:hypothetical protein